MSGWLDCWKTVLYLAIVSYFGLAIVVSIGGFFDVKRMFKRLGEAKSRPEHVTPPPALPVGEVDRSQGHA
ncbi:MAG: hypothetical protein KA354_01555 [Phycisphaerae bacterium]|nr:hypothetical protein [Phycisphaerae bacterium]